MTAPGHPELEGSEGLLAVLRIPLLVMALGGLFVIQDFGGPAALRTWPALLVLWGGLMALSRRRTP